MLFCQRVLWRTYRIADGGVVLACCRFAGQIVRVLLSRRSVFAQSFYVLGAVVPYICWSKVHKHLKFHVTFSTLQHPRASRKRAARIGFGLTSHAINTAVFLSPPLLLYALIRLGIDRVIGVLSLTRAFVLFSNHVVTQSQPSKPEPGHR